MLHDRLRTWGANNKIRRPSTVVFCTEPSRAVSTSPADIWHLCLLRNLDDGFDTVWSQESTHGVGPAPDMKLLEQFHSWAWLAVERGSSVAWRKISRVVDKIAGTDWTLIRHTDFFRLVAILAGVHEERLTHHCMDSSIAF